MPTNQKRYTCCVCGCKRVAKYMSVKYDRLGRVARGGHKYKYQTIYSNEFCNGVRLLQLSDTPGFK